MTGPSSVPGGTPGSAPGSVLSGESGWLDQLVDLHVLAANGDTTAAETARRWLAQDSRARQAWEQVQHTCDRIQNAPNPTTAT